MGSDNLHHKRKGKKVLARRAPTRAPYDRVLIVCEGSKTEPLYFQELVDYYKLSSANVIVDGSSGSAPRSVVQYAEKLYQQSQKARNAYDRVFCVFDKDAHETYYEALTQLQLAKYSGVLTAINSVPCFEYWLLLHFRYTDMAFSAGGRHSIARVVEQELKRVWPSYEKANSGTFSHCFDKLPVAIKHAKRALKAAEQCGSDNPLTRVHELVEYLQQLKMA